MAPRDVGHLLPLGVLQSCQFMLVLIHLPAHLLPQLLFQSSNNIEKPPVLLHPHPHLRHPPPVRRLGLQTHDLRRQPVDLLLRPDHVAEVHFVAVETLVGFQGPGHVGGDGRGGGGRGRRGDRQRGRTGGGGLSRVMQVLDFLLQPTLSGFQLGMERPQPVVLQQRERREGVTSMSLVKFEICPVKEDRLPPTWPRDWPRPEPIPPSQDDISRGTPKQTKTKQGRRGLKGGGGELA
ncbi:hypothetical protein EYF80_025665 [Liparis tanakae]|uniref:Uncharacterized protein n=1 Tax=Liparis tanakae TaxID=230148 RepID=A0A4Z2HE69_9TELE|nr:hypothetical protein EYF80_025665 [Liparis tanakae]